jgi:glycosyltransferase involved in cell wall biosynthesis
VDSVLAQEFQDWELIISDNGSTDATREYLRTLGDPRIRIFEQPVNLGIFGNLNFIFKEARAPLCQILCADDYFMSPGSLGQIIDFWKKQPLELGFARCNWGHDMSCRLTRFSVTAVPQRVTPEQSDIIFFTFGNVPGNLTNVSLRTRLVQDCGWFRNDLPFSGDYDFWMRAGAQTGFAVETAHWVYVRQHPASGTNTLNRKGELIRQNREIITRLFDRLKNDYPKFFLRLHATANYDAQQRRAGISVLVKRRSSQYLQEVCRQAVGSPVYLGAIGRWLIFFLTLGGRFGRVWFARCLLHFAKKLTVKSSLAGTSQIPV